MSQILKIEDLRKSFGDFTAIDGVNLSLEAGVLTSIIGPNGAGKTTLINLLTGRFFPDGGKVFFNGEEITKLPTYLRVKRGICRSFQVTNVFPRLTVFDNILLPKLSLLNKTLKVFSKLSDLKDAVTEVETVLKEIGLWDRREQLAGQLSHGDLRLLEVGIAIAVKPSLCFLDEPTSGTNPLERVTMLETIKRLSAEKRTTFVIVEHDMDVVFSLSERIVVMNRGKVLCDGNPAQIRGNKEVCEIYLGEEV